MAPQLGQSIVQKEQLMCESGSEKKTPTTKASIIIAMLGLNWHWIEPVMANPSAVTTTINIETMKV